jgi:hypothetical protein
VFERRQVEESFFVSGIGVNRDVPHGKETCSLFTKITFNQKEENVN